MSNCGCGCDGSCPVCRLGEVDNHKCTSCGAKFCSKCHGTKGKVRSKNVLPCNCKSKKPRKRTARALTDEQRKNAASMLNVPYKSTENYRCGS